MCKRYIICFLGILLCYNAQAQLGGRKSFEFLNVAPHARLAALGGINVSLADKDINFLFSNPALVGDTLAGFASASYAFYVADIGQSAFAYSHNFRKIGVLSFGVQHMSYGEIDGYDLTGSEIGSFKSGETAIVISKSHQVSNFRLGANLKTVFSNIVGFRSTALMMDIGGTFIHPEKELTVGLVLKNFGFVLSEYSETSSTKIPFDVQAGFSYKPEHMPIRISLTAYNLAMQNSVYDDPDTDEDNVSTFNKVVQHVNVGAEILIHRNVNVLIGYNALRQQELKTQNTGGNGFTIGADLKIKLFDITLSRSSYSVGNAAFAFTLAANVEKMILKKKTI